METLTILAFVVLGIIFSIWLFNYFCKSIENDPYVKRNIESYKRRSIKECLKHCKECKKPKDNHV